MSCHIYRHVSHIIHSLIRDGNAIPFTANARAPTVTMPRIKAITTGSVPSFVDLILNLNEADTSSTLAAQDTWLSQLKAKDTGKLVMYGDDTWLKLFPETFDRHDGTSSFFVAVRRHSISSNLTALLDLHDPWNRTLQRSTTTSQGISVTSFEKTTGV